MATIKASMFMALDGVVDPGVGNWHFPYFNEEMGAAVEGTHDADVMLFGRVTYDSFAGAWPGREAAGEADAAFAVQRELANERVHLAGTGFVHHQLPVRRRVERLEQQPRPLQRVASLVHPG